MTELLHHMFCPAHGIVFKIIMSLPLAAPIVYVASKTMRDGIEVAIHKLQR